MMWEVSCEDTMEQTYQFIEPPSEVRNTVITETGTETVHYPTSNNSDNLRQYCKEAVRESEFFDEFTYIESSRDKDKFRPPYVSVRSITYPMIENVDIKRYIKGSAKRIINNLINIIFRKENRPVTIHRVRLGLENIAERAEFKIYVKIECRR